jgi:hypothetical protein
MNQINETMMDETMLSDADLDAVNGGGVVGSLVKILLRAIAVGYLADTIIEHSK